MDRAGKERLLALISWGRVITVGRLQDGTVRRFILHPATPEENARSAIEYETEYQTAIANEAMTEREALEFHKSLGNWSDGEEQQIQGLQDDIHTMKRGLLDYLFRVNELEKLRATSRRAEAVLVEKWMKRSSLLHETAEHYALMAQQRYLVGRVTHTEDGQRYWATHSDFCDCTDVELVGHLVNFYFGSSRLSEATLRELARSEPWRSTWVAAKHVKALFDGSPCGWSAAQMDLVRWSHIYDMVYESLERPSEQIIEDDDLLDSWLIRQGEKAAAHDKKRESEALLGPAGGKGKGRQEVFVLADTEGARRVYGMNDPQARRLVQTTQQIAAARGLVKESELPHAKNEMREKATELRRQSISRK